MSPKNLRKGTLIDIKPVLKTHLSVSNFPRANEFGPAGKKSSLKNIQLNRSGNLGNKI